MGSRPSMGKTAFAINLSLHAAIEKEIPVSINAGDMEVAEVILAKNRNGPVGNIKLAFRKSCGRFEEIR